MNNLKLVDESILYKYKASKARPKIVIIGNSGSYAEDEDFINDADCVVRFNNYATRGGISHTQDPKRCDILFSTLDLHSSGSLPKDVVIGIPYPFKAKEIPSKIEKWYPKSNHWMVDPYKNMELCSELGLGSLGYAHPLPSIGLTALWHMYKWDAEFYVAGFAWYHDPKTNKFQNWDLKNKNYPKTWNHFYPLEIEWIIKNLIPKNNFIFSKSCTKIIKIAQDLLA
jgi:hypothetical protein